MRGPMFFRRRRAIQKAQAHIRNHSPIPLTLFAELDALGIDVTELERTTRNG